MVPVSTEAKSSTKGVYFAIFIVAAIEHLTWGNLREEGLILAQGLKAAIAVGRARWFGTLNCGSRNGRLLAHL